MGLIVSELLKLRRSMTWLFVTLVPIVTATAGSASAIPSGEIAGGWDLLWVRSIGFYGMLIFPVSIAVLASLAWRAEHEGGNWNSFMVTPASTWLSVFSKWLAVWTYTGIMQMLFLLVVVLYGKLVFRLPGLLPTNYLVVGVLVVFSAAPLCAFQSAMSAFTSSFTIPVCIGVVLTGFSTGALLLGADFAALFPYGLLTHTTQMDSLLVSGSATSFRAQTLTAVSAGWTAGYSLVQVGVFIVSATWLLDHSDA